MHGVFGNILRVRCKNNKLKFHPVVVLLNGRRQTRLIRRLSASTLHGRADLKECGGIGGEASCPIPIRVEAGSLGVLLFQGLDVNALTECG